MNEELEDWTGSLGKKASDHESCMICTKQIDWLKQENERLRDALENVVNGSDIVIDCFSFARKALEKSK